MDLGQGNGKRLLQQCIDDAKVAGMDGVVAVTSEKKRPFMSDPKFLKKQGFEEVDQAAPFFRLLALRLTDAPVPQFLDNARSGRTPDDAGITAYYSNSCPFTEFYTNHWLRDYAREKGVPLTIHHLSTPQQGAGHAGALGDQQRILQRRAGFAGNESGAASG